MVATWRDKRGHKETKELNLYKLRNNICEGNDVHCLAFTAPLLDFGGHNDSDDEDYGGDLSGLPTIVAAKKKWKKLYSIIMDRRTQIPLKQMAWKAKHE